MIVIACIVCATLIALAGITARALLRRDERRAQLQREAAMYDRDAARPVADLAAAVGALESATAVLLTTAGTAGPTIVGERATVHTKAPDDRTFFGVVTGDYTDRLVLEDAELVSAEGNFPLPGRQALRRADISWIDLHGHVAAAAALTPAAAEE